MSLDRRPHEVRDLKSRTKKAVKIERLLDLQSFGRPIDILEVGTGSGWIASYFANHPHIRCNVCSVDVADLRVSTASFRFAVVDGVSLPFDSESFDVAISNHVIEHVGVRSDQATHLSEMRRIIRPNGIVYLAVPNRWMLFEPHYRLIFLSWLPRRLRSPYLRLFRKASHYDCEPLTMRELEHLLAQADFSGENICVEALRETLDIEGTQSLVARLVANVPDALLYFFRSMSPTLIYRLTPGIGGHRA